MRRAVAVGVVTTCWLAAAEIETGRMRADLEKLTAPELHGRASLTPGHKAAADIVAAGFAATGLPVTRQEFSAVHTVTGKEQTRLEWNGEAVEWSRAGFPHDVDLEAAAVFAGYGISAPEYGYDDYAGVDAKGKVAVIFDREPAESDKRSPFLGRGLTLHAAARVKRLNARKHGAVAVLMIGSPKSLAAKSDKNPDRGSAISLFEEDVRLPVVSIGEETADRIVPGWRGVQEKIDRTLHPASRELEGRCHLRVVNKSVESGKLENVIAVLEGSDPVLKHEAVLLTSHFDHLPDKEGRIYPGANDNASGTVAVMELARVLAGREPRPRRSIVFISFGAEENGLLGSYYYAAHPLVPLEKTAAVINLDMIGRNEEHTPQTQGNLKVPSRTADHLNLVAGVYSPDLVETLRRANRKVGLRLDPKFDGDPTQNALWRCDHFPFLVESVPAIWLFGGWHPGYHEPVDTVDRLNFAKLEKVTRLAELAALRIANQDGRPRFRP